MRTSEDTAALTKALAAAQGEMKNATLNCVNPHFKNRYADLAAIRDACVPTLAKHGIAVTQATTVDENGFCLVTRLAHESGQWIEGAYPLAVQANPQAMGSQMTYARRYSLAAICGISADEDDDGEDAKKHGKGAPTTDASTITPDQQRVLQAAIMEVDADLPKFLKYLKIQKLDELPASRYGDAMAALEAKRQPKKEAA
jgi:hypothetical protein